MEEQTHEPINKNDDFTFKNSPTASNGHCPFAQIPPKMWLKIFRVPFRVRHPVLFWSFCVALLCVLCGGFFSMFKNENSVERDNCLALVTIQGVILDPGPTLAWLDKLENMPGVKGILVRVDSPGGGAAASQEIYAALHRLAQKRPVAISMGSVAASGGLMISMAGERIYANPSTVTGSIGVRMDIPQLQGLMEKIGVGQETLVTAPYKDAASYTRPLTPEARAYLEEVLMNMQEQFVNIVAEGRKMDLEKAKALANGKIFTGQQALALGLIDELGGQYAAHKWLAAKTGVDARGKLLKKPSPTRNLLQMIAQSLGVEDIAYSLGLAAPQTGAAFLYQY